MTRRELLHLFGTMTAAAVALPMLDLDQLLWVPKPIVVVPTLPVAFQAIKIEWAIVKDLQDGVIQAGTMVGALGNKAEMMARVTEHWRRVNKTGELRIRQSQTTIHNPDLIGETRD